MARQLKLEDDARDLSQIGYPNHYVDSFGNVFSPKKKLKPLNHSHGYSYVALIEKNKKKLFFIHRLVAMRFIGEIDGMQINHKDCNKKNNKLENLEIVTAKENMAHASTSGLLRTGKDNPNNILSEDQVKFIRSSNQSSRTLGATFGVSKTTILNIRKGSVFKWVKSV